MKYFTYIVILIVAAAIIAGFFIVGSPGEERLRRFDERRIQDLQLIQNEIISYWQSKGKLPETLGVLNDTIRGFIPSKDPETGSDYDYDITGELSFKLCATFHFLALGPDYAGAPVFRAPKVPYQTGALVDSPNWNHEAGYHCFERTIDPDIYKPPKLD